MTTNNDGNTMNTIEDYLAQTKSAVLKIYEAYDSYFQLIIEPRRPSFHFWGDSNSKENQLKFKDWKAENEELINERLKRDEMFVFEYLARSMLCGMILNFAFIGINKFSTNFILDDEYSEFTKSKAKAAKFNIGRKVDDIPIGLIIYAARNQAMHFDEELKNELSKEIFNRLSKVYSPTFKKWFTRDQFDLNNPNIENYSIHFIDLLEWNNYGQYEKDLREMLS